MGNLFERGLLIDTSGALLSDWKWIIDHGLSVIDHAQTTDTKATVYEVPAGKIYYISYVSLGATSTGIANLGAAEVWLKGQGKILQLKCPNAANWSAWISGELTMPVKLLAGEKVEVESTNANLLAYATCTGYLLDA